MTETLFHLASDRTCASAARSLGDTATNQQTTIELCDTRERDRPSVEHHGAAIGKMRLNGQVESNSSSNSSKWRGGRAFKFSVTVSLCFLGGLALTLHATGLFGGQRTRVRVAVSATNAANIVRDEETNSTTTTALADNNRSKAFSRYDQVRDIDVRQTALRQFSDNSSSTPLEADLDQRFPVIRVVAAAETRPTDSGAEADYHDGNEDDRSGNVSLGDVLDLTNLQRPPSVADVAPLDSQTIGEIFVAPANLTEQLRWPLDEVDHESTSCVDPSPRNLPTMVEAEIRPPAGDHERVGDTSSVKNVDVRFRTAVGGGGSDDMAGAQPDADGRPTVDRNVVDVRRLVNLTLYDTLYVPRAASRRQRASLPQLTDERFHVRESQTNGAWYMVFHEFWNKQRPNSYTLHEKRNRLGTTFGRPVVRPTLKIYFAIDRESLGDVKLKVFSLFIENATAAAPTTVAEPGTMAAGSASSESRASPGNSGVAASLVGDLSEDKQTPSPPSMLYRHRAPSVHMVDLSYAFDRQHRINVIANTVEEAFHVWSDVLYEHVQFVQIPYDGNFHNTPYNERIIVVSARHFYHRNEHTGFVETFGQSNVLAHAYYNHLHINVDKNHFYVGPHRQLDRLVYVSLVTAAAKNKLQIQLIRKRQLLRLLHEPSEHADQLVDRLLQKTERLIKAGPHYNECLYCTFLHEIGHILGLGHSDNARSLMYPHAVSDFTGIDELDKLAMRKLYRRLITLAEYSEYRLLRQTCDGLKAGRSRRMISAADLTA